MTTDGPLLLDRLDAGPRIMLTKARSLSPDKNRENLLISKHLFEAQCPEMPKTDVRLAWENFNVRTGSGKKWNFQDLASVGVIRGPQITRSITQSIPYYHLLYNSHPFHNVIFAIQSSVQAGYPLLVVTHSAT